MCVLEGLVTPTPHPPPCLADPLPTPSPFLLSSGLDSLSAGSEAYGFAMGRLVEVVVHEIIHVLGFGASHYEDWRKPDGTVYGRNNVIINKDGRPYLATPKVTKVARDYFGCQSLPGAPLENEGPSFSAISHFEYRLLQVGVCSSMWLSALLPSCVSIWQDGGYVWHEYAEAAGCRCPFHC